MEDVIQNLEEHIRGLISQCEQLKEVNANLRQTKAQLLREKESLVVKHKQTITQIETMVSRLKSIENAQ